MRFNLTMDPLLVLIWRTDTAWLIQKWKSQVIITAFTVQSHIYLIHMIRILNARKVTSKLKAILLTISFKHSKLS